MWHIWTGIDWRHWVPSGRMLVALGPHCAEAALQLPALSANLTSKTEQDMRSSFHRSIRPAATASQLQSKVNTCPAALQVRLMITWRMRLRTRLSFSYHQLLRIWPIVVRLHGACSQFSLSDCNHDLHKTHNTETSTCSVPTTHFSCQTHTRAIQHQGSAPPFVLSCLILSRCSFPHFRSYPLTLRLAPNATLFMWCQSTPLPTSQLLSTSGPSGAHASTDTRGPRRSTATSITEQISCAKASSLGFSTLDSSGPGHVHARARSVQPKVSTLLSFRLRPRRHTDHC